MVLRRTQLKSRRREHTLRYASVPIIKSYVGRLVDINIAITRDEKF